MSLFGGATDFSILGGTYVASAAGSTVTVYQSGGTGPSNALKDLSAGAAHKALPNSAARFNAPRCHQSTRARYLTDFQNWMLGEAEERAQLDRKRLIWLNGSAGAGKSAIMQTIVERCACYGVILGAFFFSRADSSRNHLNVLIPTLAYQVARAFPVAMMVLGPIILGDPLIFMASPYMQAYHLLVQPILFLIQNGILDIHTERRRVFVIDGLDECINPQEQALLIRVVASILEENHIPICFLIASRPELAITLAFQREKRLLEHFASISLDSDQKVDHDIRRFIEDGFLDIINTHPLRMHIHLPWPRMSSVDYLVRRSSKHFIFASAVMKFISSADENPARALKVIEGVVPSRTGNPFAELDALYMHILLQARYSKQVINILMHCYSSLPDSITAVSYIHQIPIEDVKLFLSDVQSLISLVPNNLAELIITPIHTSLSDFLMDQQRCQKLYVAHRTYKASLMPRLFQLIDNSPSVPKSLISFRPRDTHCLINTLAEAIENSQDTDLCLSLIDRHSCYDIWSFCVESCALDGMSSSNTRSDASFGVYIYLSAIREFAIRTGNEPLFIHHFQLYIELVLDNFGDAMHRKPQYCVVPALMFSSTPTGLYWARCLMQKFARKFRIDISYEFLFLDSDWDVTDVELKLSCEAIRTSPFNKASWGSELAVLMGLVLEQLINFRKPSRIPYSSPHQQWLRKNKPWKQGALGSPRLSSALFSGLLNATRPDEHFAKAPFNGDWTDAGLSMWHHWQGFRINGRQLKCIALLKAVVFHLRKSDCTIEVVNLARKSLPVAARWYPNTMRQARAEMDAYICRWEALQMTLQ